MTGDIILGIDPGLSGALAFIDLEGGSLEVVPMPVRHWKTSAGKARSQVDEDALAAIIRARRPTIAWVEDVHAIAKGRGPDGEQQGDGVRAAFSFGEGKGILRGVLAALGIARQYVSPQKWKDTFGLIGAKKNASKPRARSLYPACQKVISSEGKSEAVLIATYGVLFAHPPARIVKINKIV